MKKISRIAVAVALLFGVSTAAAAQTVEEKNYPYNFISVQGGAQVTLTHYKITDLITPQVAISAGRYFNSKIGARLHVQGWQAKGGFQASRFPFLTADQKYKFNAITGDLDLLLNMSNIINPNRVSDKFDWVLLAGFGVNYAWKFDEFNAITAMSNAGNYYTGPVLGGKNRGTYNGRLGTQFNFNLSRAIALGLEIDANYKNDEFNLKRNYNPDWQIAAFLGLTFKFGQPKKVAPKSAPAPAPVVREEPKPEPKPVVAPKPKTNAVVVAKPTPLKETIFYNISETDANDDATIAKVADWCKKYPKQNVTVSGYADKGTGNAKVNAEYAQQRAEKVAKALQDKGVAADRITVNSYGDTVQPFSENDKNRCVIMVGE